MINILTLKLAPRPQEHVHAHTSERTHLHILYTECVQVERAGGVIGFKCAEGGRAQALTDKTGGSEWAQWIQHEVSGLVSAPISQKQAHRETVKRGGEGSNS